MNLLYVKSLRRTIRILSFIIVCSLRRNGQLCRTLSFSYRLDQIPKWRVYSLRPPPPPPRAARPPPVFFPFAPPATTTTPVDKPSPPPPAAPGAHLSPGISR